VPRKPTLFDDLDATSTPRSAAQRKGILDDSEDDSSSLTSLSDGDFEDVPAVKRRKPDSSPSKADVQRSDEEDDDDDDELEFEDVHNYHMDVSNAPGPSGDLQLTLITDNRVDLTNPFARKGPSKLERKLRVSTHCMHIQFLMWHNAVRNLWLCDPELQGLLISHVPPSLWDEIERWRRNSGLEVPKEPPKKTPATKHSGKAKAMGGARGGARGGVTEPSRDWGNAAERLERGAVDLSHGDPLFRLMKALSAWWKKRFRVTAPGIRKWGYMSLQRLDKVIKGWKEAPDDSGLFGERIESLENFRECAQECAGSRDVGAQLYTAMLRGLGLDARMVASLQPLGFGWNKLEDAEPEREGSSIKTTPIKASASDSSANITSKPAQRKKSVSTRTRGKVEPPGSDEGESFELLAEDSDNESVVEVPETTPKKTWTYDKDLDFPHYWTEVLSPVTSKYLSVDPLVKSIVATNRELVEAFEPRGAKADKARQVMAYLVGFSQDGTAKDVTVRYLKKQLFPGRTKGVRMPIEKIPVHNRKGKIARYEQFDWFRAVMRGYERGTKDRPITETDELEQSTDLKPAQPAKKEMKEGEETLQYYKQSKEFVLERHLKREEALLPTAEPVRMFKIKVKGTEGIEEPVYSRKDVVQVKSAETWHKQGRAPLPGQDPLKTAPYRAATTNRRREIAEAEARSGQKVLQGLYSFDQTDWIIPPPIKNGIIPKNDYGNIDLFAEHMCPEGAVHVPYRGCKAVCKRLGIDYAEAVVDFEFGNRMAVPVIQGVVIAVEYHDQVMEELAKDEAERSRKEDEKRRKKALGTWRKFLMGLRIVERVQRDHRDEQNLLRDAADDPGNTENPDPEDEDLGGGFLPGGFDMEEDTGTGSHRMSGFFAVAGEDGTDDEDVLEVDHGEASNRRSETYPTPQSGAGAETVQTPATRLKKAKPKAAKSTPLSSRRRRRLVQTRSDEDEEEEDEDYENADDGDYQ
jgi:xeroderma pigmentosum group C-complementing protein